MKNRLALIFLLICVHRVNAENLIIGNSQGIPDYVITELEKIVRASGEQRITVSSKKRSVEKQVSVMLDYYIDCTKASTRSQQKGCGIERAKRVYHPDCHGGFDAYQLTNSRKENIKAMTTVLTDSLIELGEQRVCMNHVEVPGIKSKLIAVDIKPSSVKDHQSFYEAIKANTKVVKFYYPFIDGKPRSQIYDDAFHIEFARQ